MTKKWTSFALIIGIIFFCFIALAPSMLSTSLGTSFILEQINKKIPGSIQINKLSLSWFGKQKIDQLTLKDSESNVISQIKNFEAYGPLWKLFFNFLDFEKIQISESSLKIVQDSRGVTNLENALGLRKFNTKELKTPVFVENATIQIDKEKGESFNIHANGKTHQNDVKGQFNLDISLDDDHPFSEQKIALEAEKFPILVLDQTLAISDKRLSGALLAFFGEFIDIKVEQTPKQNFSSLSIFAKSPFFKAELNGKLSADHIELDSGGHAHFSLPIGNLQKMQKIFGVFGMTFLKPLEGEILIDSIQIPLFDEEINAIMAKVSFLLNGTEFALEKGKRIVKLNFLKGKAETEKNGKNISLELKTEGQDQDNSLSLIADLQIPKIPLITLDLDQLAQEGISSKGKFTSKSPQIESNWDGHFKETNSEFIMSLLSDHISIPKMTATVPYFPIDEFLEKGEIYVPIQGQVVFNQPQIHFISAPVLSSSDEIRAAWLLDIAANTLKINIIGKSAGDAPEDALKGSIRIEKLIRNGRVDFNLAALQADLHWIGFETEFMQPYITSYPLKRILGSSLDAKLTLRKTTTNEISGNVEISAEKGSEAFLRDLTGQFTLQNDNQDITFHVETNQAIGATQFEGTFHNLLNKQGDIDLKNASFSLKGNLKHFPVGVITKVVTGDGKMADTMEAALGTQVDADIFAEIKDKNGPIKANLKGLNGQLALDAKVVDNIVYLNSPLTASLKVTPQLEHAVLREYIPLLGSVISAEKPIDLYVPIEGFSLNFGSFSINDLKFQNASLKLDKLKFANESNLGKIVSLIGVESPTFEVWFTPLYFSMQQGSLYMQRTDMLIANTYPLAAWGKVNLDQKNVNMVAAISAYALQKAFGITEINPSVWLQIPIKGSTHHPKADLAIVTSQIYALTAASKAGPPGRIISTVVETAADLIGRDPVPSPTTNPLPWQDSLEPLPTSNSKTSPIEEIIEKPVDEIKKGAKKILKGIFH